MTTAGDDDVRAEFVVEPFVEGAPGHHVRMALEACRAHGLEPEMGPFATSIVGPIDQVTAAVQDMSRTALAHGATAVQVRLGETAATARFDDLHGALAQMVAAVEEQLGAPLADLSREQKQAAVRILDQRGAFLLRKAVESVGEMMGVSRITIYNYLNAIQRSDDATPISTDG
ncbi:MAG: helix-turn-helix domain-containing protein [Actinomycetota bacterium]